MQRGVARGVVFRGRADYEEFLSRLEKALQDSGTACYAWCLMPNHLHFLLRTGKSPVGRVLQSVLGGYAGYYNRKYRRVGHVFQGRFKSVLCEEEPYFLELVRYIHLNPARAGMVKDLEGLERYRWSGHGVLMGKIEAKWQDAGEVLGRFGSATGRAREAYRGFVADGLAQGRRRDLEGGGLIRSAGGLSELLRDRGEERRRGDERVLGGDRFIEKVMKDVEMRERARARLRGPGLSPARLLGKAAMTAGLTVAEVKGPGRNSRQSLARALFCKWFVQDRGHTGAEAAGILGITKAAVRKALERGMKLSTRHGGR
jgi:REP element-mobilizing transposase RayT